ncbi:hypothetical protein K0U27_10205 [archaeon]|nr:hypothetical protein [archaeon]
MVEIAIDVADYELKCRKILEEHDIKFAGLLNSSGEILAGGYSKELMPKLPQEKFQSICKELASRVAKRKKNDEELGHVKYSASRREHVVIMSFPIYDHVIMIITEPHINIDRLAYKVIERLGRQWGEFVGE